MLSLGLQDPFILIFFFVSFATLYHIIYNVYFHPLARFPGPFLAKITPLYDLWCYLWGKGSNSAMEEYLLKKYVRRQPNMLVFNDPRFLPHIYSRYADKGHSYYWFHITMGLVGIGDHREHAARRRLIASPFSNTAIQEMKPLVQSRVDEWIAALGEFADAGKTFDASPWGEFLTYDIISELAFGEPIGFIKNRHDIGRLIEDFHEGLVEYGVLTRLPSMARFLHEFNLMPLFRRLFLVSAGSKGNATVFDERDRLVDRRAAEEANGTSEKRDILTYLLSARKDASHGRKLTMEEIKGDAFLFMVAGSDTTGSFFRSFLVELLSHPELYDKIMKTEFSASPMKGKEKPGLANRPLLSACIKETLRFYPPSTLPFPRVTPKDGVHLPNDGGFIPGGFEVTASMIHVNRNKNMYGEDADQWVPDRWFRDGPQKAAEMEKYLYTFGYGPRACLGKPIAELEIELGIPQLLDAFHIEFARPEKPFDKYINYGVIVHEGVWLTMKRR